MDMDGSQEGSQQMQMPQGEGGGGFFVKDHGVLFP